LDLLPPLLHQLADVGAGQRRALEQRQQPRERRAQLVRDGRGEAGSQLLVGGELRGRLEEEDEHVGVRGSELLGQAPASLDGAQQDSSRSRSATGRKGWPGCATRNRTSACST